MNRALAGLVLIIAVWAVMLSSATEAHAQSPEPSAGVVVSTGDPRSDGEGPGLVGSPVLIALGVVALGLVTIAGTALVICLTRTE